MFQDTLAPGVEPFTLSAPTVTVESENWAAADHTLRWLSYARNSYKCVSQYLRESMSALWLVSSLAPTRDSK